MRSEFGDSEAPAMLTGKPLALFHGYLTLGVLETGDSLQASGCMLEKTAPVAGVAGSSLTA